jgi:hypothetical protein
VNFFLFDAIYGINNKNLIVFAVKFQLFRLYSPLSAQSFNTKKLINIDLGGMENEI